MKIWVLATMLAVAGIAAQPAAGASDAAAQFGARQMVEDISLSPDGKSIAIVQPTEGRGSALYVVSLAGAPELKPILSSTGSPDRLDYCRWATGTRLICGIAVFQTVGGELTGYTRIITLNADGSDMKILSERSSTELLGVAGNGGNVIDWQGDNKGAVLISEYHLPNHSTGYILKNSNEGQAVYLVDTKTLERKAVEPPKYGGIDYIADGRGTVRIMAVQPSTSNGYKGNRTTFTYRKRDGQEWLPLSIATYGGGLSTEPLAVDPDLDVVYGLENKGGRTALYKIALDGSMKTDLIFERPDADVDGLIRIGRQGRVVGASYAGEKRHAVFFDPSLKSLAASLSRALPGHPMVSFQDASADENILLLWAGSDMDPGRYYLFNKTTKSLTEVMAVPRSWTRPSSQRSARSLSPPPTGR
ncbi:MAG: prolyl oligopeptidase [Sphingomonas bacterium]|uniref:hypothetical protein n=1 Tax=Sphingomonas bacterium TaxID=1895847 RepID=UPI00262D0C8C|nr:hypothetical protein [Sphingomonas bacterium]MDB5703525.1 prolyl oligopeptidase [Sphingomonas bacterium]